MTLRVLGAAMVLTTMTTSLARADEIPENVITAADEAGVSPIDLAGAVNSTGLEPRVYECLVDGRLCPPTNTPRNAVADCVIEHESHGNPNAVNRKTGAAGLGQFLASTWRTTPQGRSGKSVFDPVANRSAVEWMLSVGRGREFVGLRGC